MGQLSNNASNPAISIAARRTQQVQSAVLYSAEEDLYAAQHTADDDAPEDCTSDLEI
jgi:hypothetical protein